MRAYISILINACAHFAMPQIFAPRLKLLCGASFFAN